MGKKKKTQEPKEAPVESKMTLLQTTDVKEYSQEFLKSEQERYNTLADDFGKTLKVKFYSVKFDTIKDAKTLLKHFEKNIKWNHGDAPLFIAAYQKLKSAIEIGFDDNGALLIDGPGLNGIYQILIKTEGIGYFAARDYMSLLANTGQGITDAMNELIKDQNELRNIHTNLNTIDNEVNARELGIQVEDLAAQEA